MGGLESVDPRYTALYERARRVLAADDRVTAVALAGSVAAGTADRWSDLDLSVSTTPEGHESFVADWPDWLAAITPTVFAGTPIAGFILNTLTADGLTLDLVVRPGDPPPYFPPRYYAVGMMSGRRYDRLAEALDYAVQEQLRGLAGPFISLIHREEHLRHLTGVPHLVGLLTTVFLAETGASPPGKHWNETFTPEQRQAVAGLPPVSATRDGVLSFGLGVAELVVGRARPLFPRYRLTWPAELAAVTARRLRTELDLRVESWLY